MLRAMTACQNALKNRVSETQIANALDNGTVKAQIPLSILNSIANGAIALETTKVTTISTVAGIPGGAAMLATVPIDLAQFYAHVFRIAQKLAFIYGYKDMDSDDGIQAIMIIFLGVMFGMRTAGAALAKFAAANAVKIGARVASKPLTKYTIFKWKNKFYHTPEELFKLAQLTDKGRKSGNRIYKSW